MDPNALLERIRKLVREILDADQERAEELEAGPHLGAASVELDLVEPVADLGVELADAVRDLDEWILGGGFVPEDWTATSVSRRLQKEVR